MTMIETREREAGGGGGISAQFSKSKEFPSYKMCFW